MMNPDLLILAAGIGSRYGGTKQIDAVGPGGACMFDYSIYDALQAGFKKIVFLISREMEGIFRENIFQKYGSKIHAEFIFQELGNLPDGFSAPEARKKPWGTGHAILCAKNTIDKPFAVINADDYYGQESFRTMSDELSNMKEDTRDFTMVAFRLGNTLSEHGSVSRGVCRVIDGFLDHIEEHEKVSRLDGKTVFETKEGDFRNIDPDSLVSMNFWGFAPKRVFPILEERFLSFIRGNIDHPKAEFYIPSAIDHAIRENLTKVRVLPSSESWFGITYAEDKKTVQAKILEKIGDGKYPENLFESF